MPRNAFIIETVLSIIKKLNTYPKRKLKKPPLDNLFFASENKYYMSILHQPNNGMFSCPFQRYFSRTTDFIDEAVQRKCGLVVVNCVMGWSRSATVVAAYLMMKKGMSSQEALETIRQSRPIRPNPGFLQQLADHENLLNKKLIW